MFSGSSMAWSQTSCVVSLRGLGSKMVVAAEILILGGGAIPCA